MADENGFDDPNDEEACEDCGHVGPINGFHTCNDEEDP